MLLTLIRFVMAVGFGLPHTVALFTSAGFVLLECAVNAIQTFSDLRQYVVNEFSQSIQIYIGLNYLSSPF